MTAAPRFAWLLDVDGPGVQLRYASEAVELAGVRYRAGLAELEIAQGDDVDVEVIDASVDWPTLGPHLALAACVLRRWQIGTGIGTAETYVLGVANDFDYGASGEPVSWVITPSDVPLSKCPDPNRIVSSLTAPSALGPPFPTLEVPQEGIPYPIVFGYPGWAPDLNDEPYPAVPCPVRQMMPYVSFTALGLSQDDVLAITTRVVSDDAVTTRPTEVFLFEDEAREGSFQACSDDIDRLGQRMVTANLLGAKHLYPDKNGGKWYAGYSPDRDPNAIRDAYSVIEYMLRRFGGTSVDWDLMPDAQPALSSYLVDTYVNTTAGDVWQWIGKVFGQTLPIVIRTSTRGRYIQTLRFTVDARRTAREIDVQRSACVRVSPVRATRISNQFTAEFRDHYDIGFIGYINLGVPAGFVNESVSPAFVTNVNSGPCVTSQTRYGVRPAPTVQIGWTWDPNTALGVLTWRAERDALPARLVQYQVPEHLRLREGVQVRLVDADVGLDELAIVEGPPVVGGAGGMVVTLRIPGR